MWLFRIVANVCEQENVVDVRKKLYLIVAMKCENPFLIALVFCQLRPSYS